MIDMAGDDSRERRGKGPDGKGPVFMALRDVMKLPEKADRKGELLDRLDHVWELAVNRTYLNKKGQEVENPDGAIAIKVVEVAAEIVEATGAHEARRPIDLSVFNGGKSAERKSAG